MSGLFALAPSATTQLRSEGGGTRDGGAGCTASPSPYLLTMVRHLLINSHRVSVSVPPKITRVHGPMSLLSSGQLSSDLTRPFHPGTKPRRGPQRKSNAWHSSVQDPPGVAIGGSSPYCTIRLHTPLPEYGLLQWNVYLHIPACFKQCERVTNNINERAYSCELRVRAH